jgi:hypothetical protein
MVFILRLLFWPIVLLVVEVFSFVFNLGIWSSLWNWLVEDIGWVTTGGKILLLVTAYYLIRYFIFWLRFTYAWHASKKLVCVKVILPRSDSKIDQEKRTEKDFKEKIAIMEQLFRAL